MLTEKEKMQIAEITLNESKQFNRFVSLLTLAPLLVDAITNAEFFLNNKTKNNANNDNESKADN